MSLENEYDKQLAELRRKMAELETLKTMHVKKLEGVQRFQDLMAQLVKEYGMSESELFVARSESIVNWIKASGKDEPPLFWRQLKEYFAAVIEKEQKPAKRGGKKKEKDPINNPTLPTGVYRSPFTNEKVEKKRRNPRQLDEWIAEFGFTEVRSWLKK